MVLRSLDLMRISERQGVIQAVRESGALGSLDAEAGGVARGEEFWGVGMIGAPESSVYFLDGGWEEWQAGDDDAK